MAGPRFIRNRGEKEQVKRRKISRSELKQARQIFSYLLPYKWIYILGLLFLVASTLTSLAFPFFTGKLVNSATGTELWWLEDIDQIALGLMGILVLQGIFSFFRIYTFSIVSEKAMADVRRDLFRKLVSLPQAFFEKRRVGELTSRITTDVQQLQNILSFTLAEFIRQLATLVIGIGLLLYYSPTLTLFMLAVFPPLLIATIIFSRFIRKFARKAQDELADTNVIVEESLQNISVVKAFTNELFELRRYGSKLREVVKLSIKTAVYRAGFVSFMITALFGAVVLVIWRGAGMVSDGDILIGDLVAFIVYMAYIGGSAAGLGDLYSQILKTLGATERIHELMHEEPETELEEGDNMAVESLEGMIEYQQVQFAYPTREDVEVLKGISLSVMPGEKIALAGSSGAGKSTIVQLLMRFYNIQGGEISIDSRNITEYDIRSLREHIGIVPQEVILFGGTIRENIGYGRTGASDEAIEEAARKANALEFIQQFPEGFDTVVGERGVKLSGGQRQRVAIARAILKDPKILILDEATSSLDAESEALVQEALDKLMENRTTIIIAHRLGTIRNVDRIYVLDEGKIVESGTHDELNAKEDGFYNKLVQLQMQSH